MMRSVSIDSAFVKLVYAEDLAHPGCVARTLVSHSELQPDLLLLAMKADGDRIAGLELEESNLDLARWIQLPELVKWIRGALPIVDSDRRFTFVRKEDVEEERLQHLARAVEDAFSGDRPMLSRVAALEFADARVGGHPLSTAALLALAEQIPLEDPDRDLLGDPAKLRQRFHEAAPDGLESLKRTLNRNSIREKVRLETVNILMGAAQRADQPNGVLKPDAWTHQGEATLWGWWVSWRASKAGRAFRDVATELRLPPQRCARLARGEMDEDSANSRRLLPQPEQMLEELREAHHHPYRALSLARQLQRPHQPRLRLYARQLCELERALSDQRLTRWRDARSCIRKVQEAMNLRTNQPPWRAAENAADLLREALSDTPSADPIKGGVATLARLGIDIAGASLSFSGQQGAWVEPSDGAPVLYLTPATIEVSPGACRFALFHQLGHLVAGHTELCGCWAKEDAPQSADPAEAFANAFAAYFLAPRGSVISLVGWDDADDTSWIQRSAADTALRFGLSFDAAVAHLMNCFGRDPRPVLGVHNESWDAWRRRCRDEVSHTWGDEKRDIVRACHALVESSPEQALSRPASPRFDDLLSNAVLERQVDSTLPQRFSSLWHAPNGHADDDGEAFMAPP